MLTTETEAAGVNGGVAGAVHPVLCRCPICSGLNVEDRGKGGTGALDKPSFTPQQAGAQITRTNRSWNGVNVLGQAATVTYSFRATEPTIDAGVEGYNLFDEQQMAATELALASWSDVANITFVRVNDAGSQYSDDGQIRLINYNAGASAAAAFAILPNSIAASDPDSEYNGDVWVNNGLDYNANPLLGGYGRTVLTHELGHSIGLSHPGNYNAGNGSPTYAAADYAEDTRQYSIMSYWNERNTGANFGGMFAAAPMLDDIAAAQRLYGANVTTRTGNTVYGFGSNTGRDWLTASTANPIICAIWDAGGIDTLNFSGYAMSQVIDLGQGHFSDTGGLTGNVAIAIGTSIENAIGGTGSDRIFGNGAQNTLDGNGGMDDLRGLGGNDRLLAGAGGAPVIRVDHDVDRASRAKAVSLDGAFNTRANAYIANATSVPHATAIVESNGTREFFSFTAAAGQTITLDIDAGSFDSLIILYDANGNRVASNDDNDIIDPGSTAYQYDTTTTKAFDAFLTYIAQTGGTYYVEVRGIFGGNPQGPTLDHASYQLNVSVTNHTLTADLFGSKLDGGVNDDVLVSGSAGDTLIGGAGIDTASYETAASGVTVSLGIAGVQNTGGGGRDTLTGVERLIGSRFADTLTGDAGDNLLSGGAGDDRLSGAAGADRLLAGAGADLLTGGAGADSFEFRATLGGAEIDTITDFVVADDTVVLAANVFQGLTVGALASGAFYTGAGAHDGDDRIIYNAATGALLFDRDGTGTATAVQFARIGTGLTLTSTDFQVV